MFRLTGITDREKVLRAWQPVLPPEMFAGIVANVRSTIGPAEFAELAGRFPELHTV